MKHIRRPAELTGRAVWNALLGPSRPGKVLDDTITADFAIIGGGFAGLSAARRLTQLAPGSRIVVLEADQIAESSAGRNSGFMVDLPHELSSHDYAGSGDDSAVVARNRRAIDFAREAVQEYQIPKGYFDEIGKVNGAVSASAQQHNQTYATHLDTLGESYETLDAQQMKELTGSTHYRSGLFTPGTVLLQPAGYIRGLAAGLSERIDIYENSPVTGYERESGAWRLQTPQGAVSAGKVILATNGHLQSFGFEKGRLLQLFLFGVMTPELDAEKLAKLGGADRWGITPSDPMGTSMRRIATPQGGNRILTRTCATLLPGMTPKPRHLARAKRVMQRKFDQRFPQLKGMQMEYAWAGHLCLSLNGVSVLREIEPDLFSACVQNGLGTTRGTLTGMGAAELACGVESDITRHFTAEDNPKKLPPRPFLDIGTNATLRLREWRARHE